MKIIRVQVSIGTLGLCTHKNEKNPYRYWILIWEESRYKGLTAVKSKGISKSIGYKAIDEKNK